MEQAATRSVRFAWMFGARTDIAFFYAPIVLGCLLLACEQTVLARSAIWGIILLNAFGAGPFHQGATWFAFFDKNNRSEYASTVSKRLIFFAGPLAVFACTIAATMLCPAVAIIVFFIWSLQHIVSQNIGILLLYHNHGGNEAIVDRSLEIKTQAIPAVVFGLIFTYRALFESARQELMVGAPHVQLTPFTSAVVWLSHFSPAVAVLALYAAWLMFSYLFALGRQVQEGRCLNVPALLFWLYSIAALTPLAFLGRTFEEGNLIPSTVHWFQYIVLNYALVRNKYTPPRSHALAGSKPMVLFLQVCLVAMVVVMSTSVLAVASAANPRWQQLLIGIVMGFGGVHYYLDAFLWRFREAYQRQTVLPYLLSARAAG